MAALAVSVSSFAQIYTGGGVQFEGRQQRVSGKTTGGQTTTVKPTFSSGEVIVKYKPGSSVAAYRANRAIGAEQANFIPQINVAKIDLPPGMTVQQAVSYYQSQPFVEYAEPNYIYEGSFVPNDPSYGQQYGLQKIQAEAGWDVSKGLDTITIAILDTGVSKNHADLAAKQVPGYDFANDDADPDDGHGHGTHVAGIAAGITDNGIGIAGLAINCKIMPVKVLADAGFGSSDWIASGITFAADNGAHVINMSLGGAGASMAVQDALIYAVGLNVLPIAAAGNHGTTQKFYPAAFPQCVAVAATDANDLRAGFSAFGDWVHVAAPGVNIYSTFPGGYGFSSGTSMACPYVAGLAGLVRSHFGVETIAQTRARIQNTCDNVGNFVIHGRINVQKALGGSGGGGGGGGNTVEYAPLTFTKYEGGTTSGTVAALATSDNVYFNINSQAINRIGQVASGIATFNTPSTTVRAMSVKVEGSAPNGSTCHVYLWNYSSGRYDLIGSFPLNPADPSVSVKIRGTFSNYRNGTGDGKALIRMVLPAKIGQNPLPFTGKFDVVKLSITS